MKAYLVSVPEIYISIMRIEAESESEARAGIIAGQGEEISCEFERTMPVDCSEWGIEIDDEESPEAR